MLSEETAVGEHPVEAVRMMDRIARSTERRLPYGEWVFNRVEEGKGDDVAEAVAQHAVAATYRLDLPVIIVPTRSGRTARLVSSFRPRVPGARGLPQHRTVRRMNLLFGMQAALAPEWTSLGSCSTTARCLPATAGSASSGDLIAVTAGLPSQELGTNLFEVHRVP